MSFMCFITGYLDDEFNSTSVGPEVNIASLQGKNKTTFFSFTLHTTSKRSPV